MYVIIQESSSSGNALAIALTASTYSRVQLSQFVVILPIFLIVTKNLITMESENNAKAEKKTKNKNSEKKIEEK